MNKNNRMKWVFLFVIIFIVFFYTSGKLLDWEAERVVQQFYVRNAEGIINGVESVAIKRNSADAIVFIHGFLESPQSFKEVIQQVAVKTKFDIYAPLLPFHGRDLKTAAALDNQKVLDFLQRYLNDLSKQYRKITVIGLSYGGALLVDLASKGKLPANANLVFYAPAVYTFINTAPYIIKAHAYQLWRNYCNYPEVDCQFPVYESGDAVARPAIENEINLRYKIVSAILELDELDSENRDSFNLIKRPYSLIVAKDDNRVSYEKLKEVCETNKQYCHFYSFPSGRHLIHFGVNKEAIIRLMIELANSAEKK